MAWKLPPKKERYYTVGGSGKFDDFTAIALFVAPDGKRDAVIGIKLNGTAEVGGFVSFIAVKFGIQNRYSVAMLELPMIYWKGGTLEAENHVLKAINEWVDTGEQPTEIFYDCLEEFEFESFYSDYEDAVKHSKISTKMQMRTSIKKGHGFR